MLGSNILHQPKKNRQSLADTPHDGRDVPRPLPGDMAARSLSSPLGPERLAMTNVLDMAGLSMEQSHEQQIQTDQG